MIIRSKTPLRLGLAGGGTDVSPFCDLYGGCVLNVTINMFSYCTIIPRSDGKIIFDSKDFQKRLTFDSTCCLPISKELPLHCGIYNHIVKNFNQGKPLAFEMITYSDAPAGSGLGTSSTMVVTILKAFQEWLNIPFGEYDLAKTAYQIERKELSFSGGKQDQYAATFGGLNFMEFYNDDRVVVNPVRVKPWIMRELENSLVLYYTGTSRDSGKIIEEQTKSTTNEKSLEAMFEIKKQTTIMKEALLRGDFKMIADSLHKNWLAKKKTASVISNSRIEEIYDYIMNNGATAAKISGAGGGGFMMIICEPTKRYDLIKALKARDGKVRVVTFVNEGAQSWVIDDEKQNYTILK